LILLLLLRVRGKEVRERAVEHERPGRRGEDVIRDEIRLDQRPGAAGAGASTTSITTMFCIGFRELQLELCDVRRKKNWQMDLLFSICEVSWEGGRLGVWLGR
jgi:hypothetical protein